MPVKTHAATHTLQQDPAEGSREVIERELARLKADGANRARSGARHKDHGGEPAPTHALQGDPAEGSREVIERELKRQQERANRAAPRSRTPTAGGRKQAR